MRGRNKRDQKAESEICPLLTRMGAAPLYGLYTSQYRLYTENNESARIKSF